MGDEISGDGSPVEAYAAFPAEPELSIVRTLLAGRRQVLDLGCGAGRIADPLAAAGLDVVAVDESAHMLQHVRLAQPLQGSIESLDVGRSFDAVLLLSHLINSEAVAVLLDAAARHVNAGGVLIAQRLEPGRQWQTGSSRIGEVTVSLADVVVDGQRIAGCTDYSIDGRTWTQRWVLWERTDDQLAELLAEVGLRLLTADGAWITAARNP